MLKQKKANLACRARILRAVRTYFEQQGYLEVETPVRMRAPLPERHIDAIGTEGLYLATSPEPHMKRMLSVEFPKIFQITKCFRAGESGRKHHPEFSMLEWYRVGAECADLVGELRQLIKAVTEAAGNGPTIRYGECTVQTDSEWEILTIDEAYRRYAGIELGENPDEYEFDRIMVEQIEPQLGLERPAIVYQYPAVFSPMARPNRERPSRAERLELYIAGLELANGCAENTDYEAQTKALREEQEARRELGKEEYPWPSAFAESLAEMPESGGVALGIDRLAMLMCNAQTIAEVISFAEEQSAQGR